MADTTRRRVLDWDDLLASFLQRAKATPVEAIDRDLRSMGFVPEQAVSRLDAIAAEAAARSVDAPTDPEFKPDDARIPHQPRSAIGGRPVRVASAIRASMAGLGRGWHARSAAAGAALGALLVTAVGLMVAAPTITGSPTEATVATLDAETARLMAESKYGEAEPLYRLALAMEEKASGPTHPKVAVRLNNLAHILQATDRLEEAEPLMLRALSIDWQHYGSDPGAVARGLNNYAQLLEATDRSEAAEQPYRLALTIFEEVVGRDHPDVAAVLNNLAHVLQATDRTSEAEALLLRALAIDTKHFGADHDSVARDLANLRLVRGLRDCDRRLGVGVERASYRAEETASRLPANPGQLLQLTKWQIGAKLAKVCPT